MLKRNNYCLGLAMKELMSTLKLPLLLNLPFDCDTQVPSKRCNNWQNLFSPSKNQTKEYGS